MHVLGRPADADGPAARLGCYRAADGSAGAAVGLDLDRPHAALVVGKRGTGKTHTLGVVAEAAADTAGVAPVVVDPMGALGGLAALGTVQTPSVRADAVPPREWPGLVGLDPTGGPGSLVWRAASARETLDGIAAHVDGSDGAPVPRRAATNALRLAASWDVFDPAGLDAAALASPGATVLDCADLPDAAARAVVAAVARALYDARVASRVARLPWLLVDEAHAFLDGGAADAALRTLLTRGRAPGVSLVAATQRPGALPSVARSQADLLVAHRLTAEPDVAALAAATPTYLDGSLRERLPRETGVAVVVDDATESVHGVRIRERETPDRGASPRAARHDERG
jgi:hypothetical protein